MIKTFPIILVISAVLHPAFMNYATAQNISKHCNIWYFNQYCGIDFNSGNAVAINNSAMATDEGSTSICDTNGVLLFYTNGISVYNASHQIMYNGTGLKGAYSTSQSCIAMQQPGSYHIWYLITVAEVSVPDGTNYSIIDMSLQGGLGEVVTKNIPMVAPTSEKLTATLQANGIDYWILVHGDGNNTFYAFPLTSAGVGAPIISNAGSASGLWTVGCMKFSPNGNRIAEAQNNLNAFQVFNFNKTTGDVTYDFTLPCGSGFGSYGVEWSRDSKHLFIGNVNYNPGQVYEADMSPGDSTSIIASLMLVVNTASDILGSLQLAPDGKIYLSRWGVYYLGVINEPDSFGVAVNYVSDGFSTSPNVNHLGLPNYVTSYYSDSIFQPASLPSFAASSTELCEKFCIDFYDSSLNNPTAWQWTFEGGSPSGSSLENPMGICYGAPGVYDVTLVVTNANGMDTLTLPDYITVNATPPFPVITQAGYTLTSSPATTYQWQLNSYDITGATNPSYTVSQSGFYSVVIGDANGCSNSASINILISGIDALDETRIFISPNPSNGIFTIEWVNGSLTGNFSINIFNAIGENIYTSPHLIQAGTGKGSGQHSLKSEIELGEITGGIYFVEIKTKSSIVRKKIIIDR
ncbi:MAG: PKD domain-containing protein [Chitinophagales bacterium]